MRMSTSPANVPPAKRPVHWLFHWQILHPKEGSSSIKRFLRNIQVNFSYFPFFSCSLQTLACTSIWGLFFTRNKEGDGSVQLLGVKTSIIEYDGASLSWQIKEVYKNTSAISEALFSSFALGSQNWTITNDNFTCSTKGKPYNKRLKLTGCLVDSFTCDNGQCIRACSCLVSHGWLYTIYYTYTTHITS